MKKRSKQEERLGCALVAVGAALLALAVAVATGAWADDAAEGAGSYVDRVWERVSDGGGFEQAMEQVGFVRIDAEDAPEWTEEICAPAMLDGAYANEGFSLVGLSRDGTKGEMTDALRRELESRGWARHDSGYEGVTTYTKDEGACRWLMTEISEAGGAASAVLHIEHT